MSFQDYLRYFIRHKSASYIVVENVKVGLVLRFTQFAVFLYMSWSLLGLKSYFEFQAADGYANLWLDNFSQTIPTPLPHYCSNESLNFVYNEAWVYQNHSCRPFAFGEVFDKRSGEFFILTYMQETWKRFSECNETTLQCKVNDIVKVKNSFVPTIDTVEIGFDHVFSTDFRYGKNVATTLVGSNGETIKEFAVGVPGSISLQDILDITGIHSLDGKNDAAYVEGSTGTAIFRMTGFNVNLRLEYQNSDTWSGKVVTAKLHVELVDAGWGTIGPKVDYADLSINEDGLTSFYVRDTYSYGIRITIEATGNIGRPDFVTAVNSAVTFSVLFALAGIVADFAAFHTPEISEKFRKKKRTTVRENTRSILNLEPGNQGSSKIMPRDSSTLCQDDKNKNTSYEGK